MGMGDRLKSIFVKPTVNQAERAGQQQPAETLHEDTSTPKARRIVLEKRQYVFGLEWRLLPPTRTIKRSLKLARQEGMIHYVLSEMEDLIGLGKELGAQRGVMFSAPLHLASKMSQGGVELYVFELQPGVFAVVALNESRPIPGFDYLGPKNTAFELAEEFKAIQAGHTVRMIGNTRLFEGEEFVEPEDVFGDPSKSARVKKIPSQSGASYMIAIALVLILCFVGAMYWLNEQRKEVMEEVRAVDVDPTKEYKASLQNSLRALPSAGPQLLNDWLIAIEKMPLIHAGWRLSKIECTPLACTAHWDREYGSYNDFNATLPPFTQTVKEVQTGSDPLVVKIETTHSAQADSASDKASRKAIQFSELPTQQAGIRDIASQLQELSLLDSTKVSLTQPKIFGANGEVSGVKEAIFSGDWTIEHQIWSLPEIQISSNMITKKLVVTMPNSKEKNTATFQLEGTYYVQAPTTP